MPLGTSLRRLAQNVAPSEDFRTRVKARMRARIRMQTIQSLVSGTEPSKAFRVSLKDRLMGRLAPLRRSQAVHTGFKWAAAFAVFILIIRAMPLLLLAPTTSAEVGVQLVPYGGDVSVYTGGVWRIVDAPIVVRGPIMVSTGEGQATLILNDDGVLRLGSNTTLKLHDTGDRPQFASSGPTATLLRGELWALGLLPPIVDGLTLETTLATLSLNAGSTFVTDKDGTVSVAVYDKGVTLTSGKQTSFLVTGEQASVKADKPFSITTLPARAFTDAKVSTYLSQDAVHRTEIARLQDERRETMAGILPTSFLYPAKRIAEQVDVLFTLTEDGRTEKRVSQANTRLSEALALIKEGQSTEASGSLTEYKEALMGLAADENDNLVKYLIEKQIADASASLSVASNGSGTSVALLRDAVAQVGAVIPDAELSSKNIEGYVLVDKLAQMTRLLRENDPVAAAHVYTEVRPYLAGLLSEKDGAHPLLQKEARSLLVSVSSLLKKSPQFSDVATAMMKDIAQYVPSEQAEILVSEEELNAQVAAMINRIFIFRHPTSRYNQLLAEMRAIEGNPNRGTLLRRLKAALPEKIGEYVNTEIQKLSDELI